MGEKDVRISKELYERLEALACEDESVGDVVDRLVAGADEEDGGDEEASADDRAEEKSPDNDWDGG